MSKNQSINQSIKLVLPTELPQDNNFSCPPNILWGKATV